MRARARLRAVRKVALAAAAAGVLSATVGVGTAGAATSSTLLYSTDGGASWSSSATVAPGGTVLVRQWYDNDGSAAETGASLSTTIPDGFTLNGGSTQVCSNPSTTNPTSPNSSELECAASNEGSVWSGSDLQVSPTAGLFGQSNGLTSGILEMGKKRYINLHECTYNSVATPLEFFIHNADAGNAAFRAGTNASNSADGAVSCGSGIAGTWNNQAIGSSVQAIDLLGNRYLNLHECTYNSVATPLEFFIHNADAGNAAFRAGTNASNSADGAVSCGSGIAGTWNNQAVGSSVQAIDLLGNRYLNLHECTYNSVATPTEFFVHNVDAGNASLRAGTNASNSADGAVSCGSGIAGTWNNQAVGSSVQAIDLLDATRGHGYVEYALTAPPGPTPEACAANPSAGSEAFAQDGSLTSTPSGAKASSGTITVDWTLLSEPPCPEDPIPLVDPMVAGAGLVAVAGAGFVLYRRRDTAVA